MWELNLLPTSSAFPAETATEHALPNDCVRLTRSAAMVSATVSVAAVPPETLLTNKIDNENNDNNRIVEAHTNNDEDEDDLGISRTAFDDAASSCALMPGEITRADITVRQPSRHHNDSEIREPYARTLTHTFSSALPGEASIVPGTTSSLSPPTLQSLTVASSQLPVAFSLPKFSCAIAQHHNCEVSSVEQANDASAQPALLLQTALTQPPPQTIASSEEVYRAMIRLVNLNQLSNDVDVAQLLDKTVVPLQPGIVVPTSSALRQCAEKRAVKRTAALYKKLDSVSAWQLSSSISPSPLSYSSFSSSELSSSSELTSLLSGYSGSQLSQLTSFGNNGGVFAENEEIIEADENKRHDDEDNDFVDADNNGGRTINAQNPTENKARATPIKQRKILKRSNYYSTNTVDGTLADEEENGSTFDNADNDDDELYNHARTHRQTNINRIFEASMNAMAASTRTAFNHDSHVFAEEDLMELSGEDDIIFQSRYEEREEKTRPIFTGNNRYQSRNTEHDMDLDEDDDEDLLQFPPQKLPRRDTENRNEGQHFSSTFQQGFKRLSSVQEQQQQLQTHANWFKEDGSRSRSSLYVDTLLSSQQQQNQELNVKKWLNVLQPSQDATTLGNEQRELPSTSTSAEMAVSISHSPLTTTPTQTTAELRRATVQKLLATSFVNYQNNSVAEKKTAECTLSQSYAANGDNTDDEIQRLYQQLQQISNRQSVTGAVTADIDRQLAIEQLRQKLERARDAGASSSTALSLAVVQAYNNFQLQQQQKSQQQHNQLTDHLLSAAPQQSRKKLASTNALQMADNFATKAQRLSEYLLQRRNQELGISDSSQTQKRRLNISLGHGRRHQLLLEDNDDACASMTGGENDAVVAGGSASSDAAPSTSAGARRTNYHHHTHQQSRVATAENVQHRSLSPAHPMNFANSFVDEAMRPYKFDVVLQMALPSQEEMERHAWNPDDRSLNIYVKEEDRLTLHRHPVAQSTDCIRGKIGYTRGFHVWQLMWPENQRGTHPVVGVATKEAILHSTGYTSLIGANTESYGWDIIQNKCYHDSRNTKGWVYPNPATNLETGFQAPEKFYCILDMDEGYMAFATSKHYLGIAFRGLKGKKLYPVVSAVWGHCEITIRYMGGLDPEPRQLMDICRRTIRIELGRSRLARISELKLPPVLMKYLMYKYH